MLNYKFQLISSMETSAFAIIKYSKPINASLLFSICFNSDENSLRWIDWWCVAYSGNKP